VEWASERVEEATARWRFARLARRAPGVEPGWLHKASGAVGDLRQALECRLPGLGRAGGATPWRGHHAGLDARFDRQLSVEAPYFFADLADTSEAEEQAVDAMLIGAGGIRFAATGNRLLPPVPAAADRASRRPEDPQDNADHQQDDPERCQDPDVGEPPEQEQNQSENEHAAASSVDVTHHAPRHSADRTLLVRTPRCQSTLA
jgi:hypothetical protein